MFLLTTATGKVSSLAVPIYLVFLVAAIIGGIYMLMYRRRINKALRENNGRHIDMPDARSVIIVILVVVLFYGVFSTKSIIKDMNEQVEFIQTEMRFKLDCMESDIENLQAHLSEIENSTKMVSSFSYSMESYDIENKTVTYILEATLKSYSDVTRVDVDVADESIELSRTVGGTYVGRVTVGMFDINEGMAEIYITEGDITTSETANYVSFSYGWMECLPNLNIFSVPNDQYNYSDKKLTFDTPLEIEVYPAGANTFTDIYLEIDLKGDDVKKVELITNANLVQTRYEVELDKYLPEIYPASIMYVYVVGVDSEGFVHRHLVNFWEDNAWHCYDGIAEIYDNAGNKLTEK